MNENFHIVKGKEWEEFIEELQSELNISPCNHSFDKTKEILEQMDIEGDLDITLILEDFKDEGAYCDCEIIENLY